MFARTCAHLFCACYFLKTQSCFPFPRTETATKMNVRGSNGWCVFLEIWMLDILHFQLGRLRTYTTEKWGCHCARQVSVLIFVMFWEFKAFRKLSARSLSHRGSPKTNLVVFCFFFPVHALFATGWTLQIGNGTALVRLEVKWVFLNGMVSQTCYKARLR